PNRVMRLPGFFHHKIQPHQTTIIHDSGALPYDHDKFIRAFQIKKICNDPLLQRLQKEGFYIGAIDGRHGGHRILCPWRNEHTTGDSGTAYFEAHTNGYLRAAFVCQHAHCAKRGIADFMRFFGDESRPKIYLKGGELTEILDQAERALVEGDKTLYQRDGFLVRMVQRRKVPMGGVKRSKGMLVIQPIEIPFLVERLTQVAHWYSSDARQKKDNPWKRCDCPDKIAKTYISRGEWSLPLLEGVITAPTLRSDGTILDQGGYDQKTGLFFHPSIQFPEFGLKSTKNDAINAVKVFEKLLKGFPFVDEASFSVAISAITSTLIRRSLPTVPLHAFNAPKKGSGKSLLSDVVGMIATGLKPTQMSQPENPAEERKRLLALLMAGDPVICIDNVERPLGSDALCTILTSETWSERLLGVNKNIEVSTNVMFLATGNNTVFRGDLTRRVLKSTIDPACERPEERAFDVNLYHYVPTHRAHLVHAALTILRAYNQAGRPSQGLSPFGSFEEWSGWVRSALVWCGLEDPCKTRHSIEEDDPVGIGLKRILMAWREKFKEPVLARTVLGTADPVLRDAIEEFVGDPQKISSKKLGTRLKKYQNRTEGGLRFVQCGTNQGAVLWTVETLNLSQ
ncbi:MAG: hypothetical protein K940chlam3_01616, partial [Chlamydiae bacterium]|nr:hypothetical protein [Chlamydiota bacterium]